MNSERKYSKGFLKHRIVAVIKKIDRHINKNKYEIVELKKELDTLQKKYNSLERTLSEQNDKMLKQTQSVERKLTGQIESVERELAGQREFTEKKMNEQNKKILQQTEEKLCRQKQDFNEKYRDLNKEILYYYHKGMVPEDYEDNLKEWFFNMTGQKLDLENPKTFNEKIQWLKLYDSTELKTRLTDKYLVRDYVAEKIGSRYLVPIIGAYDLFDEIDFDALPQKFVMKANHGSGWNIVVKDKESFDKGEARRKFRYWLGRNFAYNSGMELHYADIQRKILIEEYLEELDGNLHDYKFFCFNGQPHYIEVIGNRDFSTRTAKVAFYDLDWNKLDYATALSFDEEVLERPIKLDEMIQIAKKLSENFIFVRVDLYLVQDEIKFGEMTFTPASGTVRWNPPECNEIFGEMIQLPLEKQ